ncbi:MAG: SMC-Scp complex subunit ScpB [Pirellulales bacterium]|nr:SMC-Scp complex subunit ScpB [Pirellulales bacterium]
MSSSSPRSGQDESGLSLDQLNQAFAEMLGHGSDPYSTPLDAPSDRLAEAVAQVLPQAAGDTGTAEESASSADDDCAISPRTILEALLFVGRPDNVPLTGQQIAGLMRGVTAEEIDDLVQDLDSDYAANGCPYTVAPDGPGYRLTLRREFGPLRDRFFGRTRSARLSPAAIEVLALVAYNEPLTADEVSKLRGKPSGQVLSQLVRRQLLRVERATEKPIKTKYFTTRRFLEVFNLRSREDLPRAEDLERN